MQVKNVKTSLMTSDIQQAEKYLNSKGFKRIGEAKGTFLYVYEDTYELRDSVLENSDCKVINAVDFAEEIHKPIKDSHGKLFYEIDWRFIQQIAERMASNKGKYPVYNWKKPLEKYQLEEIKQATLRHFVEFLENNYEDDGREYGHIEAIVCNLMMYNYQIKNNG